MNTNYFSKKIGVPFNDFKLKKKKQHENQLNHKTIELTDTSLIKIS